MEREVIKQSIVLGIIILFLGASISPLVISKKEQDMNLYGDDIQNIPTFSPPSPPTLIDPGYTYTPGEMIYTLLPTFYWTNVPNANYYGLYISKYPYGPSNLVFDSEVNYGNIYGTQFDLPISYMLTSNERYAWNMRSYNSDGWGDFSSSLFFQTPQVYTITFETDPTNGGTINFNSITYTNGQVTYVFPMTFNIVANPASGYVFDHWSSTCGTVTDPIQQSTTITISSSGVLKAWFIPTPTPSLAYSPTTINFGTHTPGWTGSSTFEIWNSGTGTLSYTLSESISWITISPTSGSSTGEHDTITVNVIDTGSMNGYYSGTISISSNGGSGSVFVDITITPPSSPILAYNPTALNFGSHTPGWTGSSTFEIWNSGTGTLSYTLSESISWITISPTSGSSTGEHDTITVNVIDTGSMNGYYSGTISISSNGGSGSVFVDITIESGTTPSLAYSPSTINFGTHPAGWTDSNTFEIWNGGTGTLTYSISESIPWITVTPPSGSSTGEHDTITVNVVDTGSMNGYYSGSISISSNGGDGSVFVDITITPLNQDDLSLDSFGLIQVILDPRELITNKNTAACVLIESTFSDQVNVDIKVTYNFGQTYIEEGPNNNGVPLQQGTNMVFIPGGPVIHESGQTNQWIADNIGPWLIWTSTGTDNNIKASMDFNNEVLESDENNNEIEISKSFFDSENLRILVLPVYFPNANPPVGNNEQFSLDINSQEEAILDMYPVSQNHFVYSDPNLIYRDSGNPNRKSATKFMDWLLDNVATELVLIAKSFNFNRVVLVLHEDWSDVVPKLGMGAALGMLEKTPVHEPVYLLNDIEEYFGTTALAHELGHTYWLWHPHEPLLGPPIFDCTQFDVRNRDYGFNARTVMSYPLDEYLPPGIPINPVWIDSARYQDLIKVRPQDPEAQQLWIWNLFAQFKKPWGKQIPLDQNEILLGGIIYENGTVSPVEPWYNITIGEPNLYPNINGDYFIMLLDKDRNNLSRLGFNISFDRFYYDENGTTIPYQKNSTAFAFSIPFVDGTKYIELWDANNTIVLSKMISPHSPTVNILTPNGGETFVIGEDCAIEWNAEDLDGDSLSFSLSFSTDGLNWIPINWNLSGSQYVWNTSELPPGDNYTIRVMACDGINTESDESDGSFSFNYPEPILIGLISNMNDTENYLTIYAKWILWLNFKPFSFKVYSSNEMIQLQKPYHGFLFPPVIFGKFNAMVVSESSSSSIYPFRARLKQLIVPNP